MIDSAEPKPLFTSSEWTFEKIDEVTAAIKQIVDEELKLNYYPFRVEIVSSHQMLDAYASNGLPLGYAHWSFGKKFVREQESYESGSSGLAYEIVINSSPCLVYCMENNTMAMQSLVIAHAAFGHNAFFANNGMFKDWTNAAQIIDYLDFAKSYIIKCEEKYGAEEVEDVLDACHALQYQGIDLYRKPPKLSAKQEIERQEKRVAETQKNVNALWDSKTFRQEEAEVKSENNKFPKSPEENILYFIEKHSPGLPPWKREIVRIVRKLSQYFYPQMQTKVMNEGFACFVHYYVMTRLHEKGLLTEGAFQEFLHHHTNIVHQPNDQYKYARPINPYDLGFRMFMDIKRICEDPTDEDRKYFPKVAGTDWLETVKFAVENFKDESFIRQYLSPKVIRDLGLWVTKDDSMEDYLEVTGIQDIRTETELRVVRNALADDHDVLLKLPTIEVVDVDVAGDRTLTIQYTSRHDQMISEKTIAPVMQYLQSLWEFPVQMDIFDEGFHYEAYLVDADGDFHIIDEEMDEEIGPQIVLS